MTSMKEKIARTLCAFRGHNPDALEPGNTPICDDSNAMEVADGYARNGDFCHFLWRQWCPDAEVVLRSIREPSEEMVEEAIGKCDLDAGQREQLAVDLEGEVRGVWANMIDKALEE